MDMEAIRLRHDERPLETLQQDAESGDRKAQFLLGLRYDRGIGAAQKYTGAAKWYRLAAEQGDRESQGKLGVMYQNGYGVVRDYIEAAKWYRLAAEQGHQNSQFSLGLLYLSGDGPPKDYIVSYQWLNMSAASGMEQAREKLDELSALMSRDQILEAHLVSRECEESQFRNCR